MPDPEPTPEQAEAVRRALADARHTGPAPPEVVARLDRTLAELAAEHAGGHPAEHGSPDRGSTDERAGGGTVTDLAARRRRRRRTGLLVAAAAVVVIGLGGPAVQQLTTVDGSGGSVAEDTAGAGQGATRRSTEGGADRNEELTSDGAVVVPPVRAGHFAEDVRAALATISPLREDPGARPDAAPRCPAPDAGSGGAEVPVRYAGDPAWLLAAPEQDGARRVRVVDCAGTLLRGERITVP